MNVEQQTFMLSRGGRTPRNSAGMKEERHINIMAQNKNAHNDAHQVLAVMRATYNQMARV